MRGGHGLVCLNVTLQPGAGWQEIQAHLKDGVILCKLATFIYIFLLSCDEESLIFTMQKYIIKACLSVCLFTCPVCLSLLELQ